jgi:hypothetical protein
VRSCFPSLFSSPNQVGEGAATGSAGCDDLNCVVSLTIGFKSLLVQETCPKVKNILLLDSEGKRVAVKYYSDDWPALSAKLAFEKSVFTKTQKANAATEGNFCLIYKYKK